MENTSPREAYAQLRYQLQTCRATQRDVWHALGTFQDHLIAIGPTGYVQTRAELQNPAPGKPSGFNPRMNGCHRVSGGVFPLDFPQEVRYAMCRWLKNIDTRPHPFR